MMHRLSAMVALLVVICLTVWGCAKPKETVEPPITTDFSCNVAMTYRDMEVEGRLTRMSAGTLKLELQKPDSLSGVTMEWNGESVTVKLGALQFESDPSDIPGEALGRGLLDALDAALRAAGEAKVTEDGVAVSGESPNGAFTLLSDPETGKLLSLSVPNLGINAVFSDFSGL